MEQAANLFAKGLQLDTHPMVLGNDTMSDCLNGTFVTMNGDEVILQNDMGNKRVDNAFLPAGYEPVGIKEYGGIIYLALYNPITNKSLLGSFPSPERIINGKNEDSLLIDFKPPVKNTEKGIKFLKSNYILSPLSLDNLLRAGDKFTLYWSEITNDNVINIINNLSNYNNITDNKVTSPKNKKYTLRVGILNSLNEFVDITDNLIRWNITNNTIIDTSNKTDLYKLNVGYFVQNSYTLDGNFNNATKDKQLIEQRQALSINTYSYKLVGPLYVKQVFNTILLFNYNIYAILTWLEISEDRYNLTLYDGGISNPDFKKEENGHYYEKHIELTITAEVTYNCPDGVYNGTGGDDNYNTYDEGRINNTLNGFNLYNTNFWDLEITDDHGNTTTIGYRKIEPIPNAEDSQGRPHDPADNRVIITEDYGETKYNPTTGLYTATITKTYSLAADDFFPCDKIDDNTYIVHPFNYFIGVTSGFEDNGLPLLLENLSEEGSISLSDIESGGLSLEYWRYYVYDSSTFDITYRFKCYPKYGESYKITKIRFRNAIPRVLTPPESNSAPSAELDINPEQTGEQTIVDNGEHSGAILDVGSELLHGGLDNPVEEIGGGYELNNDNPGDVTQDPDGYEQQGEITDDPTLDPGNYLLYDENIDDPILDNGYIISDDNFDDGSVIDDGYVISDKFDKDIIVDNGYIISSKITEKFYEYEPYVDIYNRLCLSSNSEASSENSSEEPQEQLSYELIWDDWIDFNNILNEITNGRYTFRLNDSENLLKSNKMYLVEIFTSNGNSIKIFKCFLLNTTLFNKYYNPASSNFKPDFRRIDREIVDIDSDIITGIGNYRKTISINDYPIKILKSSTPPVNPPNISYTCLLNQSFNLLLTIECTLHDSNLYPEYIITSFTNPNVYLTTIIPSASDMYSNITWNWPISDNRPQESDMITITYESETNKIIINNFDRFEANGEPRLLDFENIFTTIGNAFALENNKIKDYNGELLNWHHDHESHSVYFISSDEINTNLFDNSKEKIEIIGVLYDGSKKYKMSDNLANTNETIFQKVIDRFNMTNNSINYIFHTNNSDHHRETYFKDNNSYDYDNARSSDSYARVWWKCSDLTDWAIIPGLMYYNNISNFFGNNIYERLFNNYSPLGSPKPYVCYHKYKSMNCYVGTSNLKYNNEYNFDEKIIIEYYLNLDYPIDTKYDIYSEYFLEYNIPKFEVNQNQKLGLGLWSFNIKSNDSFYEKLNNNFNDTIINVILYYTNSSDTYYKILSSDKNGNILDRNLLYIINNNIAYPLYNNPIKIYDDDSPTYTLLCNSVNKKVALSLFRYEVSGLGNNDTKTMLDYDKVTEVKKVDMVYES